jgi:cytochrome c oxidase subunit I+III
MSAIIPTFARRPMFGYTAMVLALIATAFLAFGLWVHHMFATNLPELGKSFFTAASMLIAIPTAVQIFCWIATLWTGRSTSRTPLLFVLAFFFILVLGGLTGLMLASVPLDLQVHDTYFVVAHLHYVLIGGAVFPLFGAFYYWYPQVHRPHDGRAPGPLELLAVLHRLQRRLLPDAPAGPAGHAAPRLHLPAGDGLGLAQPAGDGGRRRDRRQRAAVHHQPLAQPLARRDCARRPLGRRHPGMGHGLTVLDARPDHRYVFPEPSIWPFLSAVATTVLFIASIFTPWAVVWGAVPVAAAVTIWFWPRRGETMRHISLEQSP